MVEQITGKSMTHEYIDRNREADHICYISDLSKIQTHYPSWALTMTVPTILKEICSSWEQRLDTGLSVPLLSER